MSKQENRGWSLNEYEVSVTFTYKTKEAIHKVSEEISGALGRIEHHYTHPQIKNLSIKDITKEEEEV